MFPWVLCLIIYNNYRNISLKLCQDLMSYSKLCFIHYPHWFREMKGKILKPDTDNSLNWKNFYSMCVVDWKQHIWIIGNMCQKCHTTYINKNYLKTLQNVPRKLISFWTWYEASWVWEYGTYIIWPLCVLFDKSYLIFPQFCKISVVFIIYKEHNHGD